MGLMDQLAGGTGAVTQLGRAAQGLSRVFIPDATQGQAQAAAAHRAALEQLGAEFALPRRGWFDRVVDGLNRVPRPLLALGTLGLFVFAMVDPVRFAGRMEGLSFVPDPLWWLLGAIVSFYFGARELHYLRRPDPPVRPAPVHSAWRADAVAGERGDEAEGDNPALADWHATR